MEAKPESGIANERGETAGQMGSCGESEHTTPDQGRDDDGGGFDRREELLGLAGHESTPSSKVDSSREETAVPFLEPFWRKQARSFAYPKEFGFPGKIIRRLLEYIQVLELQREQYRNACDALRSWSYGDNRILLCQAEQLAIAALEENEALEKQATPADQPGTSPADPVA